MTWLKRGGTWVLTLGFLAVMTDPIYKVLTHYNWTEGLYFDRLRIDVVNSFLSGILPMWNPLVGPGGIPAAFAGINLWEYKTFIFPYLQDLRALVFLEFLLIFAAFSWMASRVLTKMNWPLVLASFFIFYNLDLMALYVHHMPQSSTWIAFMLLLGLTVTIENLEWKKTTPRRKTVLAASVFLIYVFSFQGTQVVVWVTQFNVMLLFSVLFFRLWSGERVWPHSKNMIYLSAVGWGALTLLWQFYWMGSTILESSRVSSAPSLGFGTTLTEFLLSFGRSTFLCLGALYWTIYFACKQKVKPALVIGLVACLVLFHCDWKWFVSDVALWSVYPPSIGLFVILAYGMTFLLLFKDKKRRPQLGFEFPVLVLMNYYFLFESAHVDGFGPRPIEDIFPQVLAVIAVVPLLSLFHPNKKLLHYSLWGLSVVYLLRAHFTVPLLRELGIVWHFRRDTVYWSVFFILQFYLGADVLVTQFREKWKQKKGGEWAYFGAVVLFGVLVYQFIFSQNQYDHFGRPLAVKLGLGFLVGCLVAFKWWPPKRTLVLSWMGLVLVALVFQKLTFRPGLWRSDADTATLDLFYQKIAQRYQLQDTQKRAILMTRRGIVSGFHMNIGLWQVNVYESVVPHFLKATTEPFFENAALEVPSRCRFPVLWFPSNLLRTFDCPLEVRNKYYANNIGSTRLDTSRKDLFEKLDVAYVFSDQKLEVDHLEPLEVESLRQETASQSRRAPEPLFLYRFKEAKSFPLLGFDANQPGCSRFTEGTGLQVNSNLFSRPILKRRVHFDFEAPEKGCVRLPVSPSRLWKVRVNGEPISPVRVRNLYMGVPVKEGENKITLVYYPSLAWFFFLSGFGFLGGLVFPWWRLRK